MRNYYNAGMEKRYRRMLAGMRKGACEGAREWSVYVLRCAGDTLYTGIAKDVEARLKQHRSGKGAAYTRTHAPVELLISEGGFTRSEALIREARIKTLPKEKKELLVSGRLTLDAPRRKRRK